MKARRFLFLFGLGFLLLLSACGASPAEEEPSTEMQPTPLSTRELLIPTQASTAIPRISEQRRLTLEFPPKIRAGDSDVVRLTLEMDELGNITPTAEIDGNEIIGEVVEIPNLYETHTLIAESRLTMAGLEVLPAEMISEPLLPGEKVTFYWSLSPDEAGKYRGTVWLYLRFIPKEGGIETRRTLSAQLIEIEATTFLGFKAGPARAVGAIGSFIGAILGFPFADDVLKFLWKKLRKGKKA
ncbi:MAG: hypothetical protein DRI32_06955 [Chloroflexi bacterium]|nr:MAG: hypothetical protein DRI32_06955 [Chloroflexota bacterium]